MVSLNTYICSSPALTQSQSNAKNIYVSNRSYSILRWLMIIKLNLWVKKAICSVKAFAPHMCFVIRQKVMDTTTMELVKKKYEPFHSHLERRCRRRMWYVKVRMGCVWNVLFKRHYYIQSHESLKNVMSFGQEKSWMQKELYKNRQEMWWYGEYTWYVFYYWLLKD